MTIQAREVQASSAKPGDPFAHRHLGNASAPRHRLHRLSSNDGTHRIEDHFGPVDLARECVDRQQPLARAAVTAARELDGDSAVAFRAAQSSPPALLGQAEILAPATPASTALEHGRSGTGDNRLVRGRVHGEYVNHVLGSRRSRCPPRHDRGRLFFYASATERAKKWLRGGTRCTQDQLTHAPQWTRFSISATRDRLLL